MSTTPVVGTLALSAQMVDSILKAALVERGLKVYGLKAQLCNVISPEGPKLTFDGYEVTMELPSTVLVGGGK